MNSPQESPIEYKLQSAERLFMLRSPAEIPGKAEEPNKQAQPDTVMEEVRRDIQKANEGTLIDETQLRTMQDWSALNDQVVGDEQ